VNPLAEVMIRIIIPYLYEQNVYGEETYEGYIYLLFPKAISNIEKIRELINN
jgi:hypothetical protein